MDILYDLLTHPFTYFLTIIMTAMMTYDKERRKNLGLPTYLILYYLVVFDGFTDLLGFFCIRISTCLGEKL